jgi:hypothetical protein
LQFSFSFSITFFHIWQLTFTCPSFQEQKHLTPFCQNLLFWLSPWWLYWLF